MDERTAEDIREDINRKFRHELFRAKNYHASYIQAIRDARTWRKHAPCAERDEEHRDACARETFYFNMRDEHLRVCRILKNLSNDTYKPASRLGNVRVRRSGRELDQLLAEVEIWFPKEAAQ